MNEKIYLSVIISVFNEEKLIKSTLIEVEDFLSKQDYNYEIIVIDDGSKDRTFSKIKDLKKSFKNLEIIKNNRNYGKGYSISKGMIFAKGHFRLFMDADSSTNISQIKNFLPFLQNGYNIVIGNRKLEKSEIRKCQSLHKKLLGNIGNMLIKILVISKISDTQCGFKVFSEKATENIFTKLTITRWGFDIEVLVIAN